jgi:hypothetical protein
MGENFSVADVMALAKDGNDGMGGGIIWMVFLFFLLAWGGNGMFGGNGNNAAVQGALTRADLCQEFNSQEALSKLDGIGSSLANGICDASYALNNSIKDLGMQVVQGNNATGMAIVQNANAGQMAMMGGFNGIERQLAQNGYDQQTCCCQVKQEIAETRFQNEQNTCAIINAVNAGTQRIIDNQNQQLIQGLRDDLQAANYTIQNNNQTSALIGMLRPFPQPAYITCSPYTSAFGNGTGCNCAYAA